MAPLISQGPERTSQDLDTVEFHQTPGLREFSGRLIARPLQRGAWIVQGASDAEISRRLAEARREMASFDLVDYVAQTDEYIFLAPAGETENQVSQRLMATGNFQYVDPDWIVYPIACPNDIFFDQQWHHQANRMQSCDGWDIHTGNPAVSVGICDTGVLTTHEDLQSHRLEAYNAVDRVWENDGGNIGPVHSHGTQTTGSAAANGNNGLGVSGVGWNLSHRMLRVSNSSNGGAFSSDLQHAARTSIEAGDNVASISYSGVDSNSNLTTATYIKSIGGLMVYAAGNDSRNLTFGDRDADDLIVAGASDQNDNKASFSAFGPFVDLVAPGVSIATTSTSNDSSYVFVSGTSFACPLTAGLIALIWSADPSLTPDQVEAILKQSADDLGPAGVDNTFGYGRVNTFNAMSLIGGGGTPPLADFVGDPTAGTDPLTVAFSDLSTESPSAWSWIFGDGETSSAQNPTHVFGPGTYTVSLTASNADGSDTLTRTNYITVADPPGPPTAAFVGSPTSGSDPLTVSFTDTSSGSPTSWSWTFGDGDTSTAQNPTHVYGQGTYTVSLTASNADGSDTLVRNSYITVSGGTIGEGYILSKNADLSTDDRVYTTSDTIYMKVWSDQVNFNNMRKNTWELRDNKRKIRQDLTNQGDGTFTASFALSGLPTAATSWEFRGKLQDNNGASFNPTDFITVTTGGGPPPTADFSGSPTAGTAPMTVSFVDLSSGAPSAWAWDFGDGGSSSTQHPAHVYGSPGSYTVSLTVSNGAGSDTLIRTDYITVSPGGGNPPVADFVGNPTSGTVPLTVDFTDLSTESPTAWAWDFGDSATSSIQHPTHIYAAAGIYSVSLTVTNADGSDTLVRSSYITASGDSSGEGFILSRNADFSTNDTSFTRSETIFMMVWSDQIDFTSMRKSQWELKDPNKKKVRQDLTNQGDGTFTAAFDLGNLPSTSTVWTWKGKLEDRSGGKFQPTVQITVN